MITILDEYHHVNENIMSWLFRFEIRLEMYPSHVSGED